MIAQALKKLHNAMPDTREGCEVTKKAAATPALKSLFGDMATLCSKAHDKTYRVVTDLSEQLDNSESFVASCVD